MLFGLLGKRRGKDQASAGVDERRNYPRLETSCVIDFKRLDGAADSPVQAPEGDRALDVVNISGGGVCLALPESQPKGTMLALNILMPGHESSVLALGRVQWCRAADEGHFETGIEFWWVGWDDRRIQEKMRGYLSGKLHEEAGQVPLPPSSPPRS